MEEIEEKILGNRDDYGAVKFRFVDTLHSAAVSDRPFSFPYQTDSFKSYLFHRNVAGVEIGWDFGVIHLIPHYSRLLAANKIAPILATNWKDVPLTFDRYFMLGLPSERVQRLENGVYSVRPAMFSISKLDEKPTCFVEQTDPMFYAEIDPDSEVNNIQGMSGGPILGMKINKNSQRAKYWVIGVQSKRREGRIICASPLSELRTILSNATDTAAARIESEDEQDAN